MKKGLFVFNHFKDYASFCLLNNVEDVCHYYTKGLKELQCNKPETAAYLYDICQSKLFREWMELFLHSVLNDSTLHEMESLVYKWRMGKLPEGLNKYSFHPSDILWGLTTCKNALINFLPNFTSDIHYSISITQELNVFGVEVQRKILRVYSKIQAEVLEERNLRLKEMNIHLQNSLRQKNKEELQLRKDKDFIDAVIDNSMDGIFAFDKEFKITAWNKTLERLNMLSKEQVIGKNIFDLFPSYREGEEGKAFKAILEGKKYDLGDRTFENQKGFYEAYMVPLYNERKEIEGGLTLIHDVTLRKVAEEKLKHRENLLREAQMIARLGSWEWIVRTNKMSCSDEVFKMLGYYPNEIELNPAVFFSHLLPEDVEEIKRTMEEAFHKVSAFCFEVKVKRVGGELSYFLVKGKVLDSKSKMPYKFMGVVWDITERKLKEEELKKKNIELEKMNIDLINIELELTKINSQLEQRVLERTKQLLIKNEELNNEICERKKIEEALKERNDELIRINDDLDNFVYTASHDLKSPISNIEGLINSLNEELKDLNGENKLIIEMINQSILKFKDTLNDLTEITKAQKNLDEDISIIDVENLIEEIKFSIKDMIVNSKANVQYDSLSFPEVRFSKANLKSIIYNLLNNAIKYKHPDRNPEIEIVCKKEEEYIVISVKDNGLGINDSQKNKIFTMFKRLHDHVEGSGIGLYLVKRIIDNSGGKIQVDSVEGEGSTFNVFLKEKE